MLRFQCINASEGVANNKLKVYICSHPDDGDVINKEIDQMRHLAFESKFDIFVTDDLHQGTVAALQKRDNTTT